MTHYTPGPWKVDEDGRAILGLFDSEYVQIAAMSRTSWSNDGGGADKNARLGAQREANAYLIAAAPALYEAVTSLIHNNGTGAMEWAIKQAQAALALAEGKGE